MRRTIPGRPFVLTLALLACGGIAVAYLLTKGTGVRGPGVVERREKPVTIVGWTDRGLQKADGTIIEIPGVRNLPLRSVTLSELTKRGVEIHPDGRVYGLVRAYHWCGTDPVSYDIYRVDLSDALVYLRVGETIPVSRPELTVETAGGSLQEVAGWNISEYMQFQLWQQLRNEPQ